MRSMVASGSVCADWSQVGWRSASALAAASAAELPAAWTRRTRSSVTPWASTCALTLRIAEMRLRCG